MQTPAVKRAKMIIQKGPMATCQSPAHQPQTFPLGWRRVVSCLRNVFIRNVRSELKDEATEFAHFSFCKKNLRIEMHKLLLADCADRPR